MIYSLKNIIKTYEDKNVLNIDELEIKQGEVYCISGPNGAGKSTLLEILAGLIKADKGEIIYKDQKELKRGYGEITMVLQDMAIFNTSVYSNVLFGLKANKIPKIDRIIKINKALQIVNLKKYNNRKAITLSGGEKRCLAIARALVLEPDVLILDEPTSELDTEAKNTMINIIKNIHKNKKITIIIASHDVEFLLSVATRAFSLFNGRKIPLSIENVFHGEIINNKIKVNNIEFYIADNRIGEVNIVIPSDSIVLSKEPISSSMRNQFRGKVVKLEKSKNSVKIWVDIGVKLISKITFTSFKKMKIMLGSTIWIEFKATSVKCY